MPRELLFYMAGLALRSIAIAAIAGIVTLWIRNVAVRHAVWVAVVIVTMLLPVADAFLPAAFVPQPVPRLPSVVIFEDAPLAVAQNAIVPAPLTANPLSGNSWWFAAGILYIAVAAGLLLRLVWGFRSVSELKRSSRAVIVPEVRAVAAAHHLGLVPDVRESQWLRVPLTVGFTDPSVIVPAQWKDWDSWTLHAVLSHELAHIRRRDWAVTVLAAIHKCIFWFNPLSWWIERQLSILSENASDEASLALTGDAVRYAEVLLQFAAAAQSGKRLQLGGVAMARKNMRSRIERVLSINRPGKGMLSGAGWIALLAMSVPVLYGAAAVHVPPEGIVTSPVIKEVPAEAFPLEMEKAALVVAVAQDPIRVDGRTMEAALVNRTKPIYPPLAKQARIQGVVVVSILVGTDGRVQQANVINGHPLLQQAAIDAVQQWVYQPQASLVVSTATVNFTFQDENAAEGEVGPEEAHGGNTAASVARPPRPSSIVLKTHTREGRLVDVMESLQNCIACEISVTDTGFTLVRPGNNRPLNTRVTVRLLNHSDLELKCLAQECTVSSSLPTGATFVQTISAGNSAVVSATAQISLSFNQ